MINKTTLLVVLLILLFSIPLLSEDTITKNEIALYPKFSYANETGFSGGAIAFYRFYFVNQSVEESKSNQQLQIEYSEKKQFEIRWLDQLYFPGNIYSLTADLKYKYWPSKFYGIGNKIDVNNSEKYTPKEYFAKLNFRREISDKYFGFLLYDLSFQKIVKSDNDGLLASELIPGSEKYLISGLGLGFGRDTRNANNYPTLGSYIATSSLFFQNFIGSDYDFSRYEIDLRTYHSIDPKQILAGQIIGIYIDDNAPFNERANLSNGLRTVPSKQYIDNLMLVSRIEYRVFPWESKILDRIGFVIFGGVGNVYGKIANISLSQLNYNYGGGLRISLFTNDKFNLRIDYGFNNDSGNISIGAGEEF